MQDSNATASQRFFCPCPRGLEEALQRELGGLGAAGLEPVDGGVGFSGDLALCYRVNLQSRIASRVLWRLLRVPYRNEEDVYRAANGLNWRDWFDPELSIRVNVSAVGSPLRSLDFITLRIKDAVCDKFRSQTGRRPSVDTAAPDVRIHAFFDERSFTLYLDTSGEPLFKRGLRKTAGEAPLRENLAAGILQLSGWEPGTPLLDPDVRGRDLADGSGGDGLAAPSRRAAQLRIREAGGLRCLALATHPRRCRAGGAARARRWRSSAATCTDRNWSLRGTISQPRGWRSAVRLKQANVLELSPAAASGVLVANPPYGVRLGEQQELAEFYPKLGDALKQRFAGWRACIFTADLRLPKLIGLKPARRIPLYNGALECRLYVFELVAGSLRRVRSGE